MQETQLSSLTDEQFNNMQPEHQKNIRFTEGQKKGRYKPTNITPKKKKRRK